MKESDVKDAKNANPKAMIAMAAFAAFLATFNETYLNVAFSPIMDDLGIDVNTVQWLATAYMLAAAIMIPISAFALRSIHTRLLFCASTLLLVVGSVVGALASSFPMLLAGRIVQALGTGMLVPVGMNIILSSAPRKKLGSYMGIMGAMTTLGPSLSVIVAGSLLATLPWNALLWVFAGLSTLCLIAGAVVLRDIATLTHPRLDAASVIFVGLGLVGVLFGVSSAFGGNVASAIGAFVLGIVFLTLFARRQGRIPEPLINLDPLKVAPFTLGVVANMLALIAVFAMNILAPTFLQSVIGMGSFTASFALFPAILLSCAISPFAGRIYDKRGAKKLLPLGFALIAVFSVAVSLAMATGSIVIISLLYIPFIGGSALVIGPVQSLALSKLSPEENPHGVTIVSTGFQIAGCIGSSVFAGVYGAVLSSELASGADMLAAASFGFLASGALIAACAVAGFIISLALPRCGKPSETGAESEEKSDREAALADIMKRNVYTLLPTDTVKAALLLFAERGISGAPVIKDGIPIGFLSDGDVMRFLANQTSSFKSAYSFVMEAANRDFEKVADEVLALPVGEVCTEGVVNVDINDDLGEVCRLLAERHLKKVPVLEDGRMVGIINRSNIAGYAVRHYLSDSRQC